MVGKDERREGFGQGEVSPAAQAVPALSWALPDQDLMLSLLSPGSRWSCWSHWPRWCPRPHCKCPALALVSSEPLSRCGLHPLSANRTST